MFSRCVVSQVKHNSYFLVGLMLGLWLALAVVPLEEGPVACPASEAPAPDEFEPHREQRPLGAAGPAAGRSVQRPRYYTTELGMRGSLMSGVLSSEEALNSRAAALNATAARLQPLRVFVAAAAAGAGAAPPRPNVVGFTDSREMLKPFHALKYLADNFLDEYDFFFLVSDTSFVNARRLRDLVGKLSVSQDVYMGTVAEDDSHYCTLDSREMLKPFHALKYLADNFLDEYDFFFLVSDTSFVNARRLKDLVGKLSVSQDVYMGTVAEDDSHYCTLEGGILLSNSVLRAVHGELDWCVRNSYSAHHHENIGRCVLHAAHARCRPELQGETYQSLRLPSESALPEELAQAVTAHPVTTPAHFYRLHAFASRLYLQEDAADTRRLRRDLAALRSHHPRQFRNYTWPAGLRDDPGLAPPKPDNRFDHLRWTLFNASHAFYPDDRHNVAPIEGATQQAVELVLNEARAWALHRWGGASGEGVAKEDARLLEGAWRWEPPYALRYRLLLDITRGDGEQMVKLVEVARPLGAARLVPAPYVTESARVTIVIPVRTAGHVAALRRHAAAAQRDGNAAPSPVIVRDSSMNDTLVSWMRAEVAAILPQASGQVLEAALPTELQDALNEIQLAERVQREALRAALVSAPRDALIVMLPPNADYNTEFLNRARMNTVAGAQWFWALGFARYSLAAHPSWAGANRPQHHTGRFADALTDAIAFYRADYEAALSSWQQQWSGGVAAVLAASPLRCIRAPDPALVLGPRGPPCLGPSPSPGTPLEGACLRAHRDDGFRHLQFGDRHSLAKLLLEERAAAAA